MPRPSFIKSLSFSYYFPLVILFFFIFASYFWPRFLVSYLSENNPWVSYLYSYGLGFIVFAGSLIWIFTRKIPPDRKQQEKYWLIAILGGFLWIFCLHGLWIYWSIQFPVQN